MKHLICVLLLFVCLLPARAQKAKLFAGPVVGSVTTTSAKIWIGYRGKGKNAVILGDTSTKRIYYPSNYSYLASEGVVSLTFDFTGLQPNHVYNVIVSIEGWKTQAKASFRTQEVVPVKDFAFNLGSCALMNTDWSRFMFPGGKTDIFTAMRHHPADFMLWLGDNIYYLMPKDYKDEKTMFHHNIKIRSSFKQYKTFLSSTPHYAIWDDHDYGPNDSDRRWVQVQWSRDFWGRSHSPEVDASEPTTTAAANT